MDDDSVNPLGRLGRPLSERFDVLVVVLWPGEARPFRAAEWEDTVALVEDGEIELECTRGGRRRFGPGAVLPMGRLTLRTLHNPGSGPVRLTAVSRAERDGRGGR
jgi:mannose-6-phosphate isomerase-like protein (cupin superfamily)